MSVSDPGEKSSNHEKMSECPALYFRHDTTRWSRILMSQNRLRYSTGTGTGTRTRLLHSFSRRFRCAVGTNGVRNDGGAVAGGGGGGEVSVGYVEFGSFRSKLEIFFLLGFTPFGHFFYGRIRGLLRPDF